MSDEKTEKPGEYIIGLTLGTLVAGAAWFLYKTKKGERLRHWWDKYFSQIQDEWAKLQAQTAAPVKKSTPRVRPKPVSKKLTFHKSGRPLQK